MSVYWDQTDPGVMNYYMSYFDSWLGVPNGTLESVAMTESSYNPQTGQFRNGCNWANACGIYQLRPIMLQDIYNRYHYQLDPTDPIQGLVGAALAFQLNRRYLQYYTGRAPGWDALVVAYNGGWKAGYNYMAGYDPGSGPRNYVAQVVTYMADSYGYA